MKLAIFTSILYFAGTSLHSADSVPALTLASPLDYQVFQRRTADEGSILVRGSAAVDADEWQCRVIETSADSAKVEWKSFNSIASGSSVAFEVKSKPIANWYRVEVRGVKGGKTVAEASLEHVGVGEVFIVAGQSNAANHGSEKQVTKTQRVSSFDGKQWSIANDPQRGATGGGGIFMPAFGDAMTAKYGVPIGLVPWFTAITTYHREQDAEDTEFRSAMKSLWSKGLTWEGPDTDTLRVDPRTGVHFNGQGLQKHGEMWAEKVSEWLDDQLAKPHDGPPTKDYKLVWRDEFEGTELDATKWQHRSLGERNGAFISADCSQLDGKGHLVITAKKVGDEYHGGMIATHKTQLWTRGYFECSVKLPTEPGMNTAFWLQGDHVADPDRGKATPDDTLHNGTEIDILEYIARQGEVAHFNLHSNGYGKTHRSMPSDTFVPGLRQGFHTYAVEWTETGYTFFIDGRRVWQSNEAISGAPEYLILDLEVSKWAGGIETAKLPANAVFDWVRVWQKK